LIADVSLTEKLFIGIGFLGPRFPIFGPKILGTDTGIPVAAIAYVGPIGPEIGPGKRPEIGPEIGPFFGTTPTDNR
jgi:hypothetical protein